MYIVSAVRCLLLIAIFLTSIYRHVLIRPLSCLPAWWLQRNLLWMQLECSITTSTQVPVQWLCAFCLMERLFLSLVCTEAQRAWSSSPLTATGRSFTRSIIASTTVAGCSTSGCFCHGWTALLCAYLSCPQQPRSSTEDVMRWHSGHHQSWERFVCHAMKHRRCSILRLGVK